MSFITNRAGLSALAALFVTGTFGTIAAGAYAQDQAEQDVLAGAEEASSLPTQEIRFVASPVVQQMPEPSLEQTEIASTEHADVASLRELVAVTQTPDTLSREMRCLAQAVYFEARGESLSGQLAVARVVINRTHSSRFPEDYCSVVTQRAQFSFVRGGTIPEPKRNSDAWSRAKAIAKIAHRNLWESEAQDSLYFHATHVSPRWARSKQARARIERHVFYR